MAKRFKFRVKVDAWNDGEDDLRDGILYPTHDKALKAGIHAAVTEGIIVVEEAEAKQKVKREWVEDDGKE